ncbi:MAG TPA: (d)CMP kinase [Nitrospiria bacterium]
MREPLGKGEKRLEKRFIIAIDGPSASGKSTTGKLLAKRMGYLYIDTGAMYRGLAWKFLQLNINIDDSSALQKACLETNLELEEDERGIRVFLDQKDITDEIRTPEVGMMTSKISSLTTVRQRLLDFQRKMGEKGGLVMEGRDIGTVVFPKADVKFFLDAMPSVRGKRRYLEFQEKGVPVDFADTLNQVEERDRLDRERKYSPLKCAKDAVRIDSTQMTIDQVLDLMMEEVGRKSKVRNRSVSQ